MDDRRLRKFFHFSENDLAANRRGKFSTEQRKRLMDPARAERKSARESAAILSVVAAAGLGLGLILGSVAPTTISRILFFAVLGVLWPSIWAGRGVRVLREARKLQEPRLRSVSGRAHLVRHVDEEFILQVRGMEFDLDGSPAGVLVEGDEYTVYYLESSEEVLSLEFYTGEK